MPYKKSKKLTMRSLVQYMATFLNTFQSKNGISSDLILSEIIIEYPNIDYKRLKITFGAYEQVHIGTTNRKKH